MKTPQHLFLILTKRPEKMLDIFKPTSGLPNMWIGVSVENQKQADARIPILLQIPAAKCFVSIEPMLGPIRLQHYGTGTSIDWVICGGESGPGARPMHPDWPRSIRDQCQSAGVPFFFKQWGGINKKTAGRLLDGQEWNERPEMKGE